MYVLLSLFICHRWRKEWGSLPIIIRNNTIYLDPSFNCVPHVIIIKEKKHSYSFFDAPFVWQRRQLESWQLRTDLYSWPTKFWHWFSLLEFQTTKNLKYWPRVLLAGVRFISGKEMHELYTGNKLNLDVGKWKLFSKHHGGLDLWPVQKGHKNKPHFQGLKTGCALLST